MVTELNPSGWDGGEEPVAESAPAEGWTEGETELAPAVEDSGIGDVQLFNKW